MQVIKRDGSTVNFDKMKIREAVCKSMKNGSGIYLPDIARLIANDAEKYFSKEDETPTIYKIESYVYDRLVHYGQSVTAKAYEGYRAVQEFKRNTNTTDDSILSLINKTNDDVMKENSNKNASIAATQRDLIAGEVSKDISRRRLIPAHMVQAHDEGTIHWHDKLKQHNNLRGFEGVIYYSNYIADNSNENTNKVRRGYTETSHMHIQLTNRYV